MKRKKLLFLSLFLALFLESFSTIEWRDLRLVGHWKINEIIHNDQKININKVPSCENRENVEFKDSTFKWEHYTYYKNRCFKDISMGKYNIEGDYVYSKGEKEWVTMLKLPRENFVILEVNDNSFTLKEKYANTVRSYTKVK